MTTELNNETGEHSGGSPCSAFVPRAGSLWLVVVECRYNVVAVCVSGKGCYIPGQETCWHFSHIAEWIAEIDPANYQSATNSSVISSLPNAQDQRPLAGKETHE